MATALPHRLRRARDAVAHQGFAQAELVTLDVFDTALFRSVAQPEDVFAIAGWRAGQRHGFTIDLDGFSRDRRRAEHDARSAARVVGRHEVTLAEIYGGLRVVHAAETVEKLRQEEVAAEADVCFANPDILALYQELVAGGRRVAFVSDTYLDRATVAALLAASGYRGPLELHVSSAYGVAKGEGGLFGRVAEATGVAPGRICHIGDNPWADVVQARRAGVIGMFSQPDRPGAGAVRRCGGEARA